MPTLLNFRRILVVAGTVLMLSPVALAAIATRTTGKICGHMCPQRTLENHGGYTFKGSTRPSKAGQVVRFSYKRPGAKQWQRFKVRRASGSGFFVLDHSRSSDRINSNHEWSVFFTPSVRPGRYILRAAFPGQGGYAASSVSRWVRVRASD